MGGVGLRVSHLLSKRVISNKYYLVDSSSKVIGRKGSYHQVAGGQKG